MLTSDTEIRGEAHALEWLGSLPIRVETGLFGVTVRGIGLTLRNVEFLAPVGSTGRLKGTLRAEVFPTVTGGWGRVWTPMGYARFPEAGPHHQRAQRFMRTSGMMAEEATERDFERAVGEMADSL